LIVPSKKITKSQGYRSFFNANKIKTRYFTVFYNNDDSNFCYGITIRKKFGNAVIRNRYRRIIKSIIREMCKLPNLKPLSANIMPRKLIINEKFSIISSDLINCFTKLFNK
jgi:ribonuclease P protein component